MTEELLDTPAQLVEFEGFGAVKSVADEVKTDVATTLGGDRFGDKEEFQTPDPLTADRFLSLASRAVLGGELVPYDGFSLDADDVAKVILIKPLEPFFATELAVHGEDEATDYGRTKGTWEKEPLEAAVAAFVGGTGEVLGGEDGEVDRAVAQQTSAQEGEAFETGKVKLKGRELFQEMVIKHPNFGRPLAPQASFLSFLLIKKSYAVDFSRLVCRFASKYW